MRSGTSLWTYLELLIQSGILPCSPNSLTMESKANSTLELLTSSPLVANMWLSTWPFHLLSMSWLEYPRAVFLGLILFIIFINDVIDSRKSSTSLCWWLHSLVWHLILLTNRQQPLPSPQSLTKITNWSNTILLVYPYCPPFAFSLTPHHYLNPLFVNLPQPCCWRFLFLLLFPLSCCVLIWSV